jgi:hypothetical protein
MSDWNGVAKCVKCGKKMQQSWLSWWAMEEPVCDWCRAVKQVKGS